MATCHGGAGQPPAREDSPARSGATIDIQPDFHPKDAESFEGPKPANPTMLNAITRKLEVATTESSRRGGPTYRATSTDRR